MYFLFPFLLHFPICNKMYLCSSKFAKVIYLLLLWIGIYGLKQSNRLSNKQQKIRVQAHKFHVCNNNRFIFEKELDVDIDT